MAEHDDGVGPGRHVVLRENRSSDERVDAERAEVGPGHRLREDEIDTAVSVDLDRRELRGADVAEHPLRPVAYVLVVGVRERPETERR